LIAAALIGLRLAQGGQVVQHDFNRNLWRIQSVINIEGKGIPAKVRLTLPGSTAHQKIYNEHFENAGLDFSIQEKPYSGNQIGVWRSEVLDGEKTVQYTFSVQLKKLAYNIPSNVKLAKAPEKQYPADFKLWLDPSEFIQSKDVLIKRHLKKIVGREKNTALVVRKIYDFVRSNVKYESGKGSKDAKATIEMLVANCGGQARLFAALSRAAGIPSRLVGGLLMSEGVKKITHVWVEDYIGGEWIPFDVVNDHYAYIPSHYLVLYRGDYSLFHHTKLNKFEYFFVINRELIPPVDNPWSFYVLPAHFQNSIKTLLLIPVGALVVAIFRTIIGVPTFGTFAPVLLALAFHEISFTVGAFCVTVVIFCGWGLRRVLDELKILVIPRLSIIVTMVVGLMLALMVIGYHVGIQKMVYVSLFPMVIITWMIERFSVIEIEDGTKAAFTAAAGTTLVAIFAYYPMKWKLLRAYLFTFPELLLVIMAALLLLGRYTGIRFTELRRFHQLGKIKK
jgi:hypothetical protein